MPRFAAPELRTGDSPHFYLGDPEARTKLLEKLTARSEGEGGDRIIAVGDFPAEIEMLGKATSDGVPVRRVKYTLSNAKRDRYNDSIAVEGWKLDWYQKGGFGPVLWAHFHGQPPIARGTAEIKGKKLVGVAEFYPEGEDEVVDAIYRAIEWRSLKGCSVGFDPSKYIWNDDEKGYDFSEQELVEFSVCNVGAHPDALVAMSATGTERQLLAKIAEREMEGLHGAGMWVSLDRLEAVVKGMGLGRGMKLYELGAADLRQAVKSKVAAKEIDQLSDDGLRLTLGAVIEQIENRGLEVEPGTLGKLAPSEEAVVEEPEEKVVADDTEDPIGVPIEDGASKGPKSVPVPVEIKVTGLEAFEALIERLEKVAVPLAKAAEVASAPATEEFYEIDLDELAAAIKSGLDPAREAITSATGKVF